MPFKMGQRKAAYAKPRWMYSVIVGLSFLMVFQGQDLSNAESVGTEETRLVPDHLFSVDFSDTEHGLATGYYGTILQTHDGGKTWISISTNIQELIRRVDMVSDKKAWAVGHRGSILYTADGGVTWNAQLQIDGTYLRDISFASETTGWAVGHEMNILHTRDGGLTWQKQKLIGFKGRDLPRLNSVKAINETTAVLAGEFGVVGYTSDGGESWKLIKSDMNSTFTAIDQNGRGAVAVGLDGSAIYLSLEGEPNVRLIDTGVKQHLFDIDFNQKGEGVAVGQTVILKFAGDTVSQIKAEETVNLPFSWYHGVHILDNGEVLAVGLRGAIIKTTSMNSAFKKIAQIGDSKTVSFSSISSEEEK